MLVLLGVAGSVVLWVLAGYPLWLWWLARRRDLPLVKRFEPRTVSILLPVRNGERWIRRKLESILALDYPRHLRQVIVILDGSEDRSERIALEYAKDGVEVVPIPSSGKAEALNEGMSRASGEILFFTDVRQTLARDSLRRLVACFADPRVGAVSGELVILDGETSEEVSTGLYWRYEKWMRKQLSRMDSVLGATGAIYAMRAELARPLPPDCLLDDVNLPLSAFFRGYRVVLEDRAKAYDAPASLDVEFRRKVRTQAGLYQTLAMYPALLKPSRNRMWVHFVSHKLGRLLLPWALIAVAIGSLGLGGVWREAALAAQGAFYGMAALDLVVPEGWRLKRLSATVRAFVVLLAAALCAVSIVFVSRQALWGETRIATKVQRAGTV